MVAMPSVGSRRVEWRTEEKERRVGTIVRKYWVPSILFRNLRAKVLCAGRSPPCCMQAGGVNSLNWAGETSVVLVVATAVSDAVLEHLLT